MHHKRTESQASKLNDVIVIGAGLSGLSAAKVCHDKGLNVLVLEARDRVGGKTLSDENGCDLGGSYFIQEHRNLFNLVAELGLKYQADIPPAIGGIPVYYSNKLKYKSCSMDSHNHHQNQQQRQDGNQSMVPNDYQHYYDCLPFVGRFNLLVKIDFYSTKRRINNMCSNVNLNEPWLTKNAHELDAMTFKQFIMDTCFTKQVKNFFINFITPINLTNEAEDCSLLFALYFIRSWGGIEKCIGMDNNKISQHHHHSLNHNHSATISSSSSSSVQTFRVVGGSQLLSTRLCQQIGEERVLLNKPVHTIDQQTNSELVTVITKDGNKFEASRVIVALPPNLQSTITFKPNIPLKTQLNSRTQAGLCTKVILYYDKAYWYDNGFNGQLFVLDHKNQCEDDEFDRSNRKNKRTRYTAQSRRGAECRRSVCKTLSTSINDKETDNMYSSTNSLQVPSGPTSLTTTAAISANTATISTNLMTASAGGAPSDNYNGINGCSGDRNNHLMLKETKESYYPQSGLNLLEEDYCPISFATPDYSRGQPSLIAHVCGSAWINYHSIEKQEDRIALVAKSYAKILHPSLMEPLSYKELNWVSEEYSRGAYTSIMTPGTMTKFGKTMSAPFGRIAFTCTEMSTYWPGTMEGAIRSGRKAALKILKDLQRTDICDEDIVDDEEVIIQTEETLMTKFSNQLFKLITNPSLIIMVATIGFHLSSRSICKW